MKTSLMPPYLFCCMRPVVGALVSLALLLLCLPFGRAVAAEPAASAPARSASLQSESPSLGKDNGDTLIIGMVGQPANLIPPLASDTASGEINSYLYVAPLRYDKNLNVELFAAETFDILEDGLLLRFTLRKGIRWQDGVELTADDVEFTYKLMIDPNTPTVYSGDYKAVRQFTKLDKYSFEVRYEKPFPRSLNTWMGAILPKHALEGEDLRATPLIRQPLSCGPYLLKEWKSGASLTLVANDDYFEGRPPIDRLVFRIIPDVTTLFLELKSGSVDVMPAMTPLQYLYQAKEPSFASQYTIYQSLASAYTYMGYNLKSPLFSDARVRRALAYAVNKQDVINGALYGLGEPSVGPYRSDHWAHNNGIEDYSYDPEKALALLAKAGWTKGGDGRLYKDKVPFSFTLLINQGNETRIKTGVILQSQLRKIGIEVKIRTVEWASFLKQFVTPGHFDAVILGWTLTQDPDVFDVWHSSRIGGLNFVGYANEEVDRLPEEARSTFDKALRKKLYDRFQEILHADQPYYFLYVPYALSAVQKRLHGIEEAPAGIFYNVREWWVPKAERRYPDAGGDARK